MSAQPPPGWYGDSSDRRRYVRWWDGRDWTPQVALVPRRTWAEGRLGRRLLVLGGLAVATVANYLSWLGSNQHYEIGSDGYEHGPYQPWPVIGFVLVLILVVVVVGCQRLVLDAAAVVATALTLTFAAYAAPSDDTGLWLVGAILVALGSFFGSWIVAALASWITDQLTGGRATNRVGRGGRPD